MRLFLWHTPLMKTHGTGVRSAKEFEKWMMDNGLSYSSIAFACGVSERTVRQWISQKVFPRDFPIASRAWLSPPERQFPSLKETGKTVSSSNYLWRIMQNCPAKPWNPVVPLRNSLPVISIPSSNRYFMSPTEMLVALSFPGIVIKSLP